MSNRAENEIAHGKKLLAGGAESIWGWGSPAGQVRAAKRARWIIEATGMKPGTRVLEIGCGTGIFTEKFAATGADVTAVDISADLLEVARERLPQSVHLIHAPFEQLPLDQPFDAIVGSSVLHHLEIKPALSHIFNLLKPGGVIGFGEPNMLNPQVMIQKNVPWVKEKLGDSPDETAFFRWQMRYLLRQAGFAHIEITPLDWLHPLTHPHMMEFVEKVGAGLEKIPLVNEAAGSLYIRAQRPMA